MSTQRQVRIFRNGRNQAIRIPREFEFSGEEVLIRQDGDRLIVEPVSSRSLRDLLASWEPLDESIADVDADLLPLDAVDL